MLVVEGVVGGWYCRCLMVSVVVWGRKTGVAVVVVAVVVPYREWIEEGLLVRQEADTCG